jgi:hypothetical protein
MVNDLEILSRETIKEWEHLTRRKKNGDGRMEGNNVLEPVGGTFFCTSEVHNNPPKGFIRDEELKLREPRSLFKATQVIRGRILGLNFFFFFFAYCPVLSSTSCSSQLEEGRRGHMSVAWKESSEASAGTWPLFSISTAPVAAYCSGQKHGC